MGNNDMPKKALVLYCPFQPNEPIPNVHLLTTKGCSGQIILEAKDDTTVVQLLGLDAHQTKSVFPQRFNDMSLAIISNDKYTTHIGQQLNCIHQDIRSTDQIRRLLSTNIDVLFVDFSNYENAWSFINELLSTTEKDIIQCIISPFVPTEQEVSCQMSIIPRQSYLMKNGSQVTAINNQTALIYSYFHSGSARTDNATEYTVKDIQKNGGNNKILAWHFMAEISHKLGFVSKYGA